MFQFEPEKARWFSQPKQYKIQREQVTITTDPGSDFWQRTYYGFQNDNAHVLLNSTEEPYFSFTAKVSFQSDTLFDQCGLAIYQNSGSWAKACIEYHDEKESWLGSVVTNRGYSDWATAEISSSVTSMYYRLSRRESDFCFENSLDGIHFHQMRIFHLEEGGGEIHFGLMACSPGKGSFEAVFTEMNVTECLWQLHA